MLQLDPARGAGVLLASKLLLSSQPTRRSCHTSSARCMHMLAGGVPIQNQHLMCAVVGKHGIAMS